MKGALLGVGIGDALGVRFETLHADDPALLAWDGTTFLGSPHLKLPPGKWTDDTQMSMCLAESLIACRGFDVTDVARRYLAWYRSGTARGMGSSTQKALDVLGWGVGPDVSGELYAVGAGSAMRAIPLGLVFPSRLLPRDQRTPLRELLDYAVKDARITHATREAAEASATVAFLAGVANTVPLDAQDVPWLREHLKVFLGSSVPAGCMREALERSLATTTIEGMHALGVGGACFEVVPTAVACLLTTTTFEEAVVRAIRLGGDTDTRAAIVGGWAGLCRAIPEPWIAQVEASAQLQQLDRELLAGIAGWQ